MHEVIRGKSVFRKAGYAEAHCDVDGGLTRRYGEIGRGYGFTQALRYLARLLRSRLRKGKGEFLTPEAPSDIVVRYILAQYRPYAREHSIARKLAVGVVDVSQQVEVSHDEGEWAGEAPGPFYLGLIQRGEVLGVPEARLAVGLCVLFELRHL